MNILEHDFCYFWFAGSPWKINVAEEDISQIRTFEHSLRNLKMHETSIFEVDTGNLYGATVAADLRST